ncbi:MAG TPA: serine/threonine protein kinase, partial [Sorangium sp.]|nr:serine/threonine protein kinase [Sorangium sp.]
MADTKEIEPADATEASVPDDHQRVAADRIGTTLEDGKWTLEALIGMGGMAAVYRAKHKLGHHSAIKMMHREYASSADLVARFEREARALARLHHPGVVTIQDAGASDNGTPYVVMELLAGESVAARAAREGPLPESEVLAIAESLLEVLVAAHRQGIVHRDIKPGNLFLEDDGTLRVLDFGVAHVARGDGRKLTAVGTTLGTIQYMPPEQLRGERVDGRADLFALGATMYRLLSGHMLHSADDDQELMRKMLQEAPIPLQQRQPNVSDATALVVERALALDREQRYPGPATMLSDIEAVIAGEQPAFAAACARGERPSDIVETPATSRDFSEEEAAASTADAAAAATTPAVPAVVRAAADEARTVKMGVVSND